MIAQNVDGGNAGRPVRLREIVGSVSGGGEISVPSYSEGTVTGLSRPGYDRPRQGCDPLRGRLGLPPERHRTGRRGRVERYLKHGLAVLVATSWGIRGRSFIWTS